MPVTNQKLIFIVVCTISSLAAVYVILLGFLAVFGHEPPSNVQQAFNHAGDVLLGALIGLLVNTRTLSGPPQLEITKLPEPVLTYHEGDKK
jgi:hypothetical protein